MRLLLVGAGIVGEVIARRSADREWCGATVLADRDVARATALEDAISRAERLDAAGLGASDRDAIVAWLPRPQPPARLPATSAS